MYLKCIFVSWQHSPYVHHQAHPSDTPSRFPSHSNDPTALGSGSDRLRRQIHVENSRHFREARAALDRIQPVPPRCFLQSDEALAHRLQQVCIDLMLISSLLFMLWFNFILGLNFISLCFKLIIIYYRTPKQREIKLKPRIKLNHNIYMDLESRQNKTVHPDRGHLFYFFIRSRFGNFGSTSV